MQCKTVSASVACACVCVLHTQTHAAGIQQARPTVRMHIELKQQTEEKRRVEGLKFSISGYRLQQCLMQKTTQLKNAQLSISQGMMGDLSQGVMVFGK